MNDHHKSQEELINELTRLRRHVAELEAQQAEAEQSNNDLRFHSEILQNMSEGVHLIRVSDGLFVYTNPTFEQMFGYESGELIGKHVSIINAPTDQDPVKTATEIIKTLNETGTWQGEIQNIKKDGTTFWCYATVTSFSHAKFSDVWIAIHQDITLRKQAEEALAKERNLLSTILENLPVDVYLKDRESRFVFINASTMRTQNMKTPEDYIGKTDFDTMPSQLEQAETIFAIEQQIMETGESVLNREDIGLDNDGMKKWELSSKFPLRDAQGNITGLVGINMNITKRKQAEQALANERNLLNTVLDNIPVDVFLKDRESRFVFMNASTMRTQNMKTPEDYIGKTDFDLLLGGPVGFATFFAIEQQIMETGEPMLNYEFIGDPVDGKQVWILSNKVPLRDAQGAITGIAGINMDITERKQTEEALAKERNLLNTILDNLPIDVFVKDRESRFVFMNAATMHTLKMKKPEDYIGKTDFDLLFSGQERASPFFSIEQQIIETGERILNREIIGLDNDGKTKWELSSKLPLRDAQGNITGLVGINLDITERKQAETLSLEHEHLKTQFQKEQEQNELIGRIISTLSHDMRTPLSVISMSRDVLARYFDQLTEEKRQEKLDTINHQIQFALQLLDDTVQMTRGRHEFHPKLVNLASLCQISIDEINLAKNSTHQLRFDNIGKVKMAIIDETLVSRILLNLLSNALKYSPEGSEIRLELNRHDKWIVLQVIDQGIGISSENLPHIFDLLYRADNVGDIQGTGLGLSIVKDCVERHQGIMTVQSELEKGSIFTIQLYL